MAVQQIRGRTTTSQAEFESFSFSSNSLIFTDAAPECIEPFSLELTLGDGWNESYSPSDRSLIQIRDEIVIRKNGSIVVEVAEQLQVPHNKYGIVMPTGSLFLTRGIVFPPAKVEPAFADKLKLRLFNTTQNSVTLKKGDKLASVIFFPTESTERQTRAVRGSEISRKPSSKLEDFGRWLEQNKTVWIGWIVTIVSGSLIAFLLTYFVYYKPTLALLEKHQNPAPQQSSEPTKREE